jgi:hypothetical protein
MSTGCTRSGRGVPSGMVHTGDSGWPTGSRAQRGSEYGRWRPRAHSAGSKQWQRPLGRPLGQTRPGKTSAGWAGFKVKTGFNPWP